MTARQVLHDLRAVRSHADAFVVQEFRWPWYWHTLAKALNPIRWATYPNPTRSLTNPVRAAQAVGWRRRLWSRAGSHVALLHHGAAGISEDRYLRAVLLRDRKTGLEAWHGGTHFVVHGAHPNNPHHNRQIMDTDLTAFDRFLDLLTDTEHPVIFELDANITADGATYDRFRRIVREHGGHFAGGLGVEYLIVIPGATVEVKVLEKWTIPTSELETDHEGRGITYVLRTKV